MGEIPLSQEIIEHVLQFADGETLLTCTDVSPQFAAAVRYLNQSQNIWKKCYSKEKGEKYPFAVISKLHPHNEGLMHPKNWGGIYETCFFTSVICGRERACISQVQIGKDHSDILDVQTHGDLILVLVKYNKNFSVFHRILTIDVDNVMINKSVGFNADMLYLTPIEDSEFVRCNAINLHCESCRFLAVPVDGDADIKGYPRFKRKINFLTVEHSNGDVLWLNNLQGLLSKGNCFHIGGDSNPEEIKMRDSKSIKVFQRFTSLFICCGRTYKEFNTFKELGANVTASMSYSNLLILGTGTGVLYVYHVNNESDLNLLDLKCYISHYCVCSNSILGINVLELQSQFVIVCCSAKYLYKVHINRNLKTII